ncbi:protein DMP3-like [Hibiscus syriacus]|uniref:protein DMP3-like n=1 Tax=Hibiscus syriacus TaxID=106335 RepID=UPI001921BD38|nr:protein DMP3-like [Hibiscus syriacus]
MASIKLVPQSAHKALPFSANLANLLPTGTVFAFQAIIPSFSNSGRCELAHKYMTLGLIIVCSVSCFLSSFTDSFVGNDGKLYYGIATINGLWVFNDDVDDGLDLENDEKEAEKIFNNSFEVQRCFFPKPGPNGNALMTNLPLGVGILASGLFVLFPTKRRGIGYGDNPDHGDGKEEKQIEEIGPKVPLPNPK